MDKDVINKMFQVNFTTQVYEPSFTVSHSLRRHIEAITPISDQEFDYVLSHFSPKKLRKHQFLVQEGDPVSHDYFVVPVF